MKMQCNILHRPGPARRSGTDQIKISAVIKPTNTSHSQTHGGSTLTVNPASLRVRDSRRSSSCNWRRLKWFSSKGDLIGTGQVTQSISQRDFTVKVTYTSLSVLFTHTELKYRYKQVCLKLLALTRGAGSGLVLTVMEQTSSALQPALAQLSPQMHNNNNDNNTGVCECHMGDNTTILFLSLLAWM